MLCPTQLLRLPGEVFPAPDAHGTAVRTSPLATGWQWIIVSWFAVVMLTEGVGFKIESGHTIKWLLLTWSSYNFWLSSFLCFVFL